MSHDPSEIFLVYWFVMSRMSLGVYVDATKQHILKSTGLSPATAPQATNYHKDYFILQLMEQIQEVYT